MNARRQAFVQWNSSLDDGCASERQIRGSSGAQRRSGLAAELRAARDRQETGRDPFHSSRWCVERSFLPTADIPKTWQSLLSFEARSPLANAQVQYRHAPTG